MKHVSIWGTPFPAILNQKNSTGSAGGAKNSQNGGILVPPQPGTGIPPPQERTILPLKLNFVLSQDLIFRKCHYFSDFLLINVSTGKKIFEYLSSAAAEHAILKYKIVLD